MDGNRVPNRLGRGSREQADLAPWLSQQAPYAGEMADAARAVRDQADVLGVLQASPPGGSFTQVGAGNFHSCGITSSGSIECWGNDAGGQSSPPSGTFTELSVGAEHACALDAAGGVQCWGLGTGAEAPAGLVLTEVAAGGHNSSTSTHTCGILEATGTVTCWGSDSDGQAASP